MTANTWSEFITLHARGDRNADIARRIGVDSSNITRWRKSGKAPEPQAAVAFARAYGVNPLSALVAAGYLNASDLHLHLSTPDLSALSTTQLLDELQKRLAELRDTFDTLSQTGDRAALESLVDALASRHLPPANVGGEGQASNVSSLADYQTRDLEIGYDPNDHTLVEESLADRHAALTGDDPESEQTAPTTP